MTRIAGVLLDVDGTLVDSNDAHARAYVEALRGSGIECGFEQVRRLIGMGGDKLLPEVAGIEADSDIGRRISEAKRTILRERYLPELGPVRGARPLLLHLRARKLKRVVASSASGEELEQLLRAANVEDLVEGAATADDAEESKPDPDIVHAAIDRAKLPREALVLIGDTPYDVEAARRAGVGVIALRSGGWGDADLEGSLAIYDDPADLLGHFDSSPFAG